MKHLLIITIIILSLCNCVNNTKEYNSTSYFKAKAANWQQHEQFAPYDEIIDGGTWVHREAVIYLYSFLYDLPKVIWTKEKVDYWKTADEFIDDGYRGDCEDISIFVYTQLRLTELFNDSDLAIRIVEGKDRLGEKVCHAVVVVYTDTGVIYIDNGRYSVGRPMFEKIKIEFNLFAIYS